MLARYPATLFKAAIVTLALGLSCTAAYGAATDHEALLVQNPELALKVRTDLIEREHQEIFANFHMWDSTGVGLQSLARLCLKAQAGVKVRLVSDGLSRDGLNLISNSSLLKVIDDVCVSASGNKLEVKFWNPVNSKLTALLKPSNLHRSHEKVLLLVGQQIAYEGDRNWQNVNFGRNPKHPAYSYLSTDIVVHGPIINEVRDHLEKVWNVSTKLDLRLVKNRKEEKENPGWRKYSAASYAKAASEFAEVLNELKSKSESTDASWRHFHPVSDVNFVHYDALAKLQAEDSSVNDELLELISSAQKKVYLTTPYLRLPDSYFEALKAARLRGVEVKLVTSNPRSKIVSKTYGFQNRDIKRLKKIGVQLYQTGGVDPLHMKSVVVDDTRVFVGTHNFDMRSAYMDMESGFIVSDPITAKKLQDFLLPYEKPYKLRRPVTQFLLEPLVQGLLKISIIKKQL